METAKRILCLTDSMAMPRENVAYEDTWYSKLVDAHSNITFKKDFLRARSTKNLLKDLKSDCKDFAPDTVILQLGLTDCAPRIINDRKLTWRIIRASFVRMHLIDTFWKLVKRYFHRTPDTVYRSLPSFRKDIERSIKYLIEDQKIKNVLIVKIGLVGSVPDAKSPHWNTNIHKYNAVFDEVENKYPDVIQCIDPLSKPDDSWFVSDGFHCNEKGHQVVFDEIERYLTNI